MGGYLPHLTVDLKTNILYTYVCNEWSLEVIKHPLFISSGSTSSSINKSFNFASVEVGGESVSPVPGLCVVNNGMLYVIANDNSSTNLGAFLYKTSFDEWAGNYGDQVPGGVRINLPFGSVTDMYYEDGYLYLLVGQNKMSDAIVNSSDNSIYCRGVLIKYDVSSNTIVNSVGGIETPNLTDSKKLYLSLYYGNNFEFVYSDTGLTTPFTVAIDFPEFRSGDASKYFPKLYAPLKDQKAFSNPTKIIAIKPKKLVVADDGVMFYTDNDAWNYKNSNRIITVDLDRFIIDSVNSADVEFESRFTSHINVDRNAILYHCIGSTNFGQDKTYKAYSASWNPSIGYDYGYQSDMYVAIKCSDN